MAVRAARTQAADDEARTLCPSCRGDNWTGERCALTLADKFHPPAYHSVYTATPRAHGSSLRTLSIPITTFTEPATAVRLMLDQRAINDWNEIDAVRLIGYRIN